MFVAVLGLLVRHHLVFKLLYIMALLRKSIAFFIGTISANRHNLLKLMSSLEDPDR